METVVGKRILILTERYYPEEFLINDLSLEFRKKGARVDVLTQAPSYPKDCIFSGYKNRWFQKERIHGIQVYRVRTLLGYNRSVRLKILGYLMFSFLTSLVSLLIGKRYDFVFVYHTGPATMAMGAVPVSFLYRKPVYIWTQDIWPDAVFGYGITETPLRRRILILFLRWLYNHFTRVSVSCPGFVSIIKEYYSGVVSYIPQWYAGSIPELVENKIKKQMEFTYLGNLGSVQNLPNVIRGFALLRESGFPARLNIVGDGIMFLPLKELVRDINVPDVVFYGRRPSSEMEEFIKNSNVMVISLIKSDFMQYYIPAKLQGYLSGGRPVLAIMSGTVAQMVQEHNLGYTADPNSIEDIARSFQKFFIFPDELEVQGRNSKLLFEEAFKKEKCLDQMYRFILS